jgi:hypothetical protein
MQSRKLDIRIQLVHTSAWPYARRGRVVSRASVWSLLGRGGTLCRWSDLRRSLQRGLAHASMCRISAVTTVLSNQHGLDASGEEDVYSTESSGKIVLYIGGHEFVSRFADRPHHVDLAEWTGAAAQNRAAHLCRFHEPYEIIVDSHLLRDGGCAFYLADQLREFRHLVADSGRMVSCPTDTEGPLHELIATAVDLADLLPDRGLSANGTTGSSSSLTRWRPNRSVGNGRRRLTHKPPSHLAFAIAPGGPVIKMGAAR